MKKICNFILSFFVVATISGLSGSLLISQPLFAADPPVGGVNPAPNPAPTTYTGPSDPCNPRFLTFPAWYRGLTEDSGTAKCDLKKVTDISAFVWHIALNVIEIGLQLVGYVATGLILFGGFKFLTSSGDTAAVAAAKKTIIDAVIGLVISLASIAIINLIFSILP